MQPVTRTIRVALAGNPNSGKTSVFNLLTGLHHQVGNWPGVTVERKSGAVTYGGYRFEFVDLPGIYSLTAYSIEERIAREYIIDELPDVVIDVVDSGNLERNLYLTTQLLEMGVDVIVDLNMWDEFSASGARLDRGRLETLLGTPVVTTVAHRGEGKQALLEAVIRLSENRSARHRHVPISFGTHLEEVVADLTTRIAAAGGERLGVPARYLATKLLEGDPHIVEILHNRVPAARAILAAIDDLRQRVEQAAGQEPSRTIMEGRYGFISGLLREVFVSQTVDRMEFSSQLDRVLTHRIFGLPIFFAFMWLLFNGTFTLGAYPQTVIAWLVEHLAGSAQAALPAGLIREALVDGVISGVGSVAIFMPNIMLLFLGISILEDSGYMARAAFIMDRVMHLLGLHGKSFIPMLMGFGCTVPAIMATRTLESRRDRILTSLVLSHMSCSARLPVYILFAGAFFERQAGNVIMLVYLFGILVALLIGRLFSRTLFRHEAAPFVMELPPYRWPTGWGLLFHVWERSRHYLKKMGGVILIASLVLWVMSVFPRAPQPGPFVSRGEAVVVTGAQEDAVAVQSISADGAAVAGVSAEEAAAERRQAAASIEYSIMGRLGKAIEPVLRPLGFDWQLGVSLITGFVAKEVVVSSLAVIYQIGQEDDEEIDAGLTSALRDPKNGISPLVALAYMAFVLLYTPCIVAILTIRREIGTRWMWFDVGYQLALAWLVAFAIYQGGQLIGLG
ncbi:MAG: ferrous iron transport protein B [Candidatus Eisenbacteria sp.]|nr:ferrous iron transport protein B [Candidatus Eisenbacteria bacterium]